MLFLIRPDVMLKSLTHNIEKIKYRAEFVYVILTEPYSRIGSLYYNIRRVSFIHLYSIEILVRNYYLLLWIHLNQYSALITFYLENSSYSRFFVSQFKFILWVDKHDLSYLWSHSESSFSIIKDREKISLSIVYSYHKFIQ